MIRNSRILILLATITWWGLMACNQLPGPQKGIELGNPDPTPITIRITPQGGMTAYDVTLGDKNQASVTRTDTSTGRRDTVVVPYNREEFLVTLQASFPIPEDIQVTLLLDSQNKVISATLKVNGEPVTVDFEHPEVPTVEGDSGVSKSAMVIPHEIPAQDEMGPPSQITVPQADFNEPTFENVAP